MPIYIVLHNITVGRSTKNLCAFRRLTQPLSSRIALVPVTLLNPYPHTFHTPRLWPGVFECGFILGCCLGTNVELGHFKLLWLKEGACQNAWSACLLFCKKTRPSCSHAFTRSARRCCSLLVPSDQGWYSSKHGDCTLWRRYIQSIFVNVKATYDR